MVKAQPLPRVFQPSLSWGAGNEEEGSWDGDLEKEVKMRENNDV